MSTYADRFGYFNSVASFLDMNTPSRIRKKLNSSTGTEEINCLRCDQLFLSEDRKTNRICEPCKRKNDKYQDISGVVNYLPKSITTASYIEPLVDEQDELEPESDQ